MLLPDSEELLLLSREGPPEGAEPDFSMGTGWEEALTPRPPSPAPLPQPPPAARLGDGTATVVTSLEGRHLQHTCSA